MSESGQRVESILRNAPLLWRSEAFRKVIQEAERAAMAGALVVILGESGTGKRRIAQHIHEKSPRAGKPLKIWSAPQAEDTLLQSLLMGHEKGGFTGAIAASSGLIRAADGTTLVVDDAHMMSRRGQQLLFEFLDEPVVSPVGATEKIRVDVRLIVATNRDLRAMADQKEFHSDLANRFLEGLVIRIPPFRDRKEDIAPLAEYLIDGFAPLYGMPVPALAPGALGLLERCPWSGNARELAGVLHNAVFRLEAGVIQEWDIVRALGDRAQGILPTGELALLAQLPRPERLTERVMRRALYLLAGNGVLAARALGIPLRTFRRYLKKYRIEKRLA